MFMKPVLAAMGVMFSRASKTLSRKQKELQVRALATNPGDQSQSPRCHVEEKINFHKLFPDLHTCALTHTCTHVYTWIQ